MRSSDTREPGSVLHAFCLPRCCYQWCICLVLGTRKKVGMPSFQMRVLLRALICITLPSCYFNFNVDLRIVRPYSGNPDSYFGYSVNLCKKRSRCDVLVGAPHDNATQASRYAILEPGALYGCPVTSTGQCNDLLVDKSGVRLLSSGLPLDTKAHQLLGMTVASSPDGSVITCAPHYVYNRKYYEPEAGKHRDPTGTCFYSTDQERYNFTEYSPCRDAFEAYLLGDKDQATSYNRQSSYHQTGHGMCGFSVAAASLRGNAKMVAIGAPGSFYWQGQLYTKINSSESRTYSAPGSDEEDDIYTAYAIAIGNFDGADGTAEVVASAPRANFLKGRISIYQGSPVRMLFTIGGDQPGSYLGYSLASADVDGNGFDDVVAGAPMWSDYGLDRMEAGAVYVYRWRSGPPQLNFQPAQVIRGSSAWARFGSSVASMGDVNRDGAGDVAIGAPYGGPDGNGVVYIYHGTVGGQLRDPYAQVIYASDVGGGRPPISFGWSLSSGVDVDGNSYPDLAIGAYKSNSAFLLKTKPIVNASADISVQPSEVFLAGDCETSSASSSLRFVDVNVTVCLSYSTLASDLREPENITLRVAVSLDSEQELVKRAFGKSTGASVVPFDIVLNRDIVSCTSFEAYVTNAAKDKVSPIIIFATYDLIATSLTGTESTDAALNAYRPSFARTQATILKNCGADNVCHPQLVLTAQADNEFHVLGADDNIDVNVVVENVGEDAFNASLIVELPAGVSYVNVAAVSTCPPVACQQLTALGANVSAGVVCDIGNPLTNGRTANFTLRTRLSDKRNLQGPNLTYYLVASSTFGSSQARAAALAVVRLRANATVYVTGIAVPNTDVQYNDTQIAAGGEGPSVRHVYEVFTNGPSDVSTAQLVIWWPSFIDGKGTEHLLYLVGKPHVTAGRGACIVDKEVTDLRDASTASGRRKRENQLDATVVCDPAINRTCVAIICSLFDLTRTAPPTVVSVDAALWLGSAFAELTRDYSSRVAIQSTAYARALAFPYGLEPLKSVVSHHRIASYFERYRVLLEVTPLDWKWIAIGVACGVVFLVVIVVIMWRCGFFKRDRPTFRGEIEKERALLTDTAAATDDEVNPET